LIVVISEAVVVTRNDWEEGCREAQKETGDKNRVQEGRRH